MPVPGLARAGVASLSDWIQAQFGRMAWDEPG